MNDKTELQAAAARVVAMAKDAGAQTAEALARRQAELQVRVRDGAKEQVEEAISAGLGLRVLSEDRSATAYTSDLSEAGLKTLVADAVELAAYSAPDPLAAPPPAEALATGPGPALELFDPSALSLDASQAIAQATACEAAAREVTGVTGSEGARYRRVYGTQALVTSGGFGGAYDFSFHSVSMKAIAEDAGGKKRTGSEWDGRRFLSDLRPAAEVGAEAGRRAVAKLGARKLKTCSLPIVFSPDAGRALLSLLGSCLLGRPLVQRASYLVDQLGELVASPQVQLVDDALLPRGPGSRPFDGEGLPSQRTSLIEDGRLRSYLLDSYAARKLALPGTASAHRGLGGRPNAAPSNLLLQPGTAKPEALWADLEEGLYVTSMMGFGFNPTTGDFSRGAEGFAIRGGQLAFPVSEVTIGANFRQLWADVDAVADDLDLRSSTAAPHFRVRQMTVAGS